MTEQKKTVLFITANQKFCNELQISLPNEFIVAKISGIEAINHAVKNSQSIGAIIVHIIDAEDFMTYEMLSTAYQSVTLIAVLDAGLDDTTIQNFQTTHTPFASFSSDNLGALPALIIPALQTSQPPVDTMHLFLGTMGNISREILRIQSEFTETSFRTLPNPVVAGTDTLKRLEENLNKLKEIRINS